MLQETIRQLAAQRAACKQWSVLVATVILVGGALGRLNTGSLLWTATPLLLLGLAEIGYAAREGYCAECLGAGKRSEPPTVLPSEPVLDVMRRMVVALVSVSVWPFYLVLWGTVAAGAIYLPKQTAPSPVAALGETSSASHGPNQPAPPTVHNGGMGYPPGMNQRYPNVTPYSGLAPGNSGMSMRTPGPGFPRPVTPVNFGPKPLVRPLGSPPTVYFPTPAGIPAAPPVRQNP